MSTLEQPKGDEPGEHPDEAPTDANEAPVDPDEGSGAGPETVSEVDESEPTQTAPEEAAGAAEASSTGSSLERCETEDPLEASEIAVDPTKVRKAPRFGRFAIIGVLLGVLVALVQTLLANPDTIGAAGGPWASNSWGFFWLMSAIFVPIGVLLMCGIALLVDRRARRVK